MKVNVDSKLIAAFGPIDDTVVNLLKKPNSSSLLNPYKWTPSSLWIYSVYILYLS